MHLLTSSEFWSFEEELLSTIPPNGRTDSFLNHQGELDEGVAESVHRFWLSKSNDCVHNIPFSMFLEWILTGTQTASVYLRHHHTIRHIKEGGLRRSELIAQFPPFAEFERRFNIASRLFTNTAMTERDVLNIIDLHDRFGSLRFWETIRNALRWDYPVYEGNQFGALVDQSLTSVQTMKPKEYRAWKVDTLDTIHKLLNLLELSDANDLMSVILTFKLIPSLGFQRANTSTSTSKLSPVAVLQELAAFIESDPGDEPIFVSSHGRYPAQRYFVNNISQYLSLSEHDAAAVLTLVHVFINEESYADLRTVRGWLAE